MYKNESAAERYEEAWVLQSQLSLESKCHISNATSHVVNSKISSRFPRHKLKLKFEIQNMKSAQSLTLPWQYKIYIFMMLKAAWCPVDGFHYGVFHIRFFK